MREVSTRTNIKRRNEHAHLFVSVRLFRCFQHEGLIWSVGGHKGFPIRQVDIIGIIFWREVVGLEISIRNEYPRVQSPAMYEQLQMDCKYNGYRTVEDHPAILQEDSRQVEGMPGKSCIGYPGQCAPPL